MKLSTIASTRVVESHNDYIENNTVRKKKQSRNFVQSILIVFGFFLVV